MRAYTKLFKTMLVVHFAKQGSKPFLNAIKRLAGGFLGAVGFGIFIAKAVRRASLPPDLPDYIISVAVLGIGFILGGFILLAIGSSQSANSRGTAFQRIITVMPLGKTVRWLLYSSPSFIILGLISVVGIIALRELSLAMHATTLSIILAWIVGLLSGYGCMNMRTPKSIVFKGVLFIAIVFCALFLFDQIFKAETVRMQNSLLAILYTSLLFPLVGLLHSYRDGIQSPDFNQAATEKQIIPKLLPHDAWFMVKIWRNRRTRGSLLLALAFSVTSAISLAVRQKTFDDPFGVLLFGAILSATFACDVRGVMRRYIPPEMVLLKGTKGIVEAETVAVVLCGYIIGLPMVIALFHSVSGGILFILFYIALQMFSSLAGLLAGTVFVPRAGETGSQFFSAVLAIALVLCLPKLGRFSNIAYESQFLYWITASVVATAFIYLTELYRRKNYGHA